MYQKKIRRKIMLLLCMMVVLCILSARGRFQEAKNQGEMGEILILPEESDEVSDLQEEWTLPGRNAMIRVLLLNENGEIFHEDKELAEEYPGSLDCFETDKGTVIVNEVPLEEYLCRVVPSEMPASYSMEALKAQAVCARTYAVWQMQEYAYPEYKAHVDDSVSYQVYNGQTCQDSTDQAVEATQGQIMLYGDQPIKAYYFSTSCGSTTDENIWEKGNPDETPYIVGRIVGDSESGRDLTKEDNFTDFIRKKHAGDLEIAEPWYRWNCYVPLSQIRKNVEQWIRARAERSEDGVLLQDGENYVWPDVNTIGAVKKAEIVERNTGGAVQQMLITGEKGTLKIKYEYNIRLMLGIPGGEIRKNDGTVGVGSSLLPSGYFVLENVEEDGKLVGYQIYGGGLGHGAGMSQNGARILAEQGNTYEEILRYFYQGIHLALLEES